MCEIKLSCVEVNCDTEKGGALLNIASHILDIVQNVTDPVQPLAALDSFFTSRQKY